MIGSLHRLHRHIVLLLRLKHQRKVESPRISSYHVRNEGIFVLERRREEVILLLSGNRNLPSVHQRAATSPGDRRLGVRRSLDVYVQST